MGDGEGRLALLGEAAGLVLEGSVFIVPAALTTPVVSTVVFDVRHEGTTERAVPGHGFAAPRFIGMSKVVWSETEIRLSFIFLSGKNRNGRS